MRAIHSTILLAVLSLLLAACGGAASPTATPRPSPTPFPTFAFVAPTSPAAFSDSAVRANDEDAPDLQAIERGRDRYVALECAACHGEAGEGVDGEASLLAYDAPQVDFIDFMRSGGEFGAEHQFSTDRLSRTGGENLYAYLISLGQEGE